MAQQQQKKVYVPFTIEIEGRFLLAFIDKPVKEEYKLVLAVPKSAPGATDMVKAYLAAEREAVKANYPNAPDTYKTDAGKTARSWHSKIKDGDKELAKKTRNAERKGKQVNESVKAYAGCWIVEARSKNNSFGLSKFDGGKIVDDADPKEFYPGAYGCLEVNITAFENDSTSMVDNPYLVTGYLNMILKTRDGKRLAGRRSGASAFAGAVSQLIDDGAGVAEDVSDVDVDDDDDDSPF